MKPARFVPQNVSYARPAGEGPDRHSDPVHVSSGVPQADRLGDEAMLGPAGAAAAAFLKILAWF